MKQFLLDITGGYTYRAPRYGFVNGVNKYSYDFMPVTYFWLGASVLSFVLVLFVWNAKSAE